MYPRAYTSMATYYLHVEKDAENALNYLFMAAKANCADDNFLGNDKVIAGLTNAYMGEIYYKSFHDEDTAIGYYEKALSCELEKAVEGEVCDSLYKIYTDRGDDENAAKYKERRSGLKIMLDMFSGNWTSPPPKTLHDRLRNPKNKDINLEDLPYHYSKLPDDFSKKMEMLKPIQEEFEKDLLENPAYKEFFANYTPKTVRQFCENYAAHKNLLVSNWECYIDEPSKEVEWRKYAEKMLELILFKKLFNLQLQWRADQVKIPGIRVTLDFQYWNMTLNHEIFQCSFIEPITPEEITVMKQFLADDNFFDSTNSWLCGWQEYDKIMEKDEEGDLPLMPIWYEFYDSMMGTGSLLLLNDERGEKEKFYESIYWEWYRKQPPPTAVPPPPPPAPEPLPPQPLFTYDGTKYTEFMEKFENDYLCKLHQGWLEERKKPDETYDEDAVREAIMELADADEPLYMDSSLVWHQAILRCAQKFKNKKVAEKMDEVYATYLMQHELKLNGPVKLDDDVNTSYSKQRSDEIMERILKGRELNGEPRDLNF
jgi:hypothetical protein